MPVGSRATEGVAVADTLAVAVLVGVVVGLMSCRASDHTSSCGTARSGVEGLLHSSWQ